MLGVRRVYVYVTVCLPTFESEVTGVAAGGFHTCAVLQNGQLKCWGFGKFGQLGQGNERDIGDELYEMGENLSSISLGSGRSVLQVAAGGLHSCALLDNNAVKCWGDGRYGQLGQENALNVGSASGEMGDNLQAVDLGSGRHAVQISTGAWHSCALLDDASVKCWGAGLSGSATHSALGALPRWATGSG